MDSRYAGQKILEALTREPHLTKSQVARLFYRTRQDGTPAKAQAITFRDRNKVLYKEPGYDSAKDQLTRMRRRGEVNFHRLPKEFGIRTVLYMLPGQKPPSNQNWPHEITCGWLFVAYELAVPGVSLDSWDHKWSPEEYKVLSTHFTSKVFKYDRRMEHPHIPNLVFWEVDKGTETRETLLNKIQNYIRLHRLLPKERFTVVFTVNPSKWANPHNRIEYLLEEFANVKMGTMFAAGMESEILADPMGAVVYTSLTGPDQKVALSAL